MKGADLQWEPLKNMTQISWIWYISGFDMTVPYMVGVMEIKGKHKIRSTYPAIIDTDLSVMPFTLCIHTMQQNIEFMATGSSPNQF